MADDLERAAAFRRLGVAVQVDTADPPGKSTVVFDTADLDVFLSTGTRGRTYAEGIAEGRRLEAQDAADRAGVNLRAQLARQLTAAKAQGSTALADAVAELARGAGIPTDPRPSPDPAARDAMTGTGPSTGASATGRLRP